MPMQENRLADQKEGGVVANEPVLHGEYDEFAEDVKRRLKGHDAMYEDVSDFKASLRELTTTVRTATADISAVMGDNRDPDGKCAKCKEGLEGKIEEINRWRWRVIGAIGAFLAIPTIISCVILIRSLGGAAG
jgi:anti-sigma-K factor RskA